ncbi:MAG: TetR/AcrR family transcriptional regulator [Cellulomonadaceae bacterium]
MTGPKERVSVDELATTADAASAPTATELLWNGLPQGERGRQRGLSLAQIVKAAIDVADASGIESLSMRSIAQHLGVGAMTLYRYVPSKAALLDLTLDHLQTPSDLWGGELPGTGPRWRRALILAAREGREMYLAHPWLMQVNWSRPAFGPNTLATFEALLAHLGGLALSDRQRINLVSAVDALVTGAVRAQIMYQQAPQETGLSDEDYWASQGPVLEHAMATGQYPTLETMAEDSFDGHWDEVFELGLTALLDGIAARFVA